ncbi:MAG: AAA family ATPase [Chitinophagaceae bacterium]|nr:AAA family ATPase [Chitinophagaceae bacterium]
MAIIGPESTGKSTLCTQLAEYYKTAWVPEYAREYLLKYGPSYTYDDLLCIAKKQLELEDLYAAKASHGLLFVDTEMYVMKIWCEFVFGKTHQWILDQIASRTYDLYLLCNIDLPWTRDELREYPDLKPRQQLFNMYKDNMINQHVPWKIIEGTEDERIKSAVNAVEQL